MMARTKAIPTIAYIGIAAATCGGNQPYGGARRPGSIPGGSRWKGRVPPNEDRGHSPVRGVHATA